jgi:hypothetical protein
VTTIPHTRYTQQWNLTVEKDLGANLVRTAHYIQDKSIMEAAAELGLLVWEEIPTIKIYDYQPGPMTEQGDSRYTRTYIDNCLAVMGEMIRRDRNHPSVILILESEGNDRLEKSVGIVSEYRRDTNPSELPGVVVPAKAGTHCPSNGFPLAREFPLPDPSPASGTVGTTKWSVRALPAGLKPRPS